MRWCLLVSLVMSATVRAELPRSVLIFSGGKTRAAAEAALASFKKLEPHLSSALTLAQGEPRIVESDSLPGLKPGFFVVTLGVCSDTRYVLPALKAVYPGVYERELEADRPESCPELSSQASLTVAEGALKARDLTVNSYYQSTTFVDDRGDQTNSTTLVFVLVHRATGQVRDVAAIDVSASRGEIMKGTLLFCEFSLANARSSVVLTSECRPQVQCEAGPEHTIVRQWVERTNVEVRADRLHVTTSERKVTETEQCPEREPDKTGC